MTDKRDEYVEHAFQLFESRGPATAYAYMQHVGIDVFPPTFVYIVQQELRLARSKRDVMVEHNRQLRRAHA